MLNQNRLVRQMFVLTVVFLFTAFAVFPGEGAPNNDTSVQGTWYPPNFDEEEDLEEIIIDVTDEETEKLILEAKIAQQWLAIEEDLKLRPYDEAGMKLVEEYRSAKYAPPPAPGTQGAIVITYGTAHPKVICRPLRVTDIQFQAGESILNVDIGDSVRWSVSPAMSGSGSNVATHAMIKPLMPNISTNIVVNTNKRTYHIELLSQEDNYMPYVVFAYPEEQREQWQAYLASMRKDDEETLETSVLDVSQLNFDYKIEGKPAWKPARVFDDGTKTYFEMPNAMRSTEAPVFMVVRNKKQTLVNYRVKGKHYIVDRIFDKGILISGHGAIQERVVITRTKRK